MSNQSNSKEEAYLDRNLVVMTLAKLAKQQGYPVGIKQDPQQPEWPVIMIDLPSGQVSWHIPVTELIDFLPDYQGEWDGHTLQQKRERVKDFITDK